MKPQAANLVCNATRRVRRAARRRWPHLSRTALENLTALVEQYQFSVTGGDLAWIERGWYVTHTGLLSLAARRNRAGIEVHPLIELCSPRANRWVFSATVYPTRASRGFSGFGDADPANVGEMVRGAELRIAETRAVNRALRKAYGVGLCSVEELGSLSGPPENGQARHRPEHRGRGTLEVIATPSMRDQLRQIIRQHQLDPVLIKSYALAHLGLKTMREASREQVADLIAHLQKRVLEDRDQFFAELSRIAAPDQGVA
ncbi:MAG: hypothetical protein ROO76_14390 [Terriglobia bacterium]|nr:hypothetical protein [Terriglobia bacterium]